MEESQKIHYPVRFIPIGDSLTIGHGAGRGNSWPEQLGRQLKQSGLDFTLVQNPAHSGWTSQLALDHEIPVFENSGANFASVLIGANDMAKGVELSVFQRNFVQILDRIQKKLSQPDQLLVLNLPDFAATPAAQKYHGHLHLAPYLGAFNKFIEDQAKQRGLEMADLYSFSRKLGPDPTLFIYDGLHPSAKGYTEWEKFIRPFALKVLAKYRNK